MSTESPTLPDIQWSSEDDALAAAEGWNIFEAHGVQEIERIDSNDIEGAPEWPSDDAAIAHVSERALAGSLLHLRAMAIHAHFALMLHYENGEPIKPRRFAHRFTVTYALHHDSPDGSGIPTIDHYHAILGRAHELVEIAEGNQAEADEIIGEPDETYENE